MKKTGFMPFLLPIRCIIFLFIFILASFITNNEISEISNWWSVVASIVNILTLFILILSCKKSKISFAELINYQKGKTKLKQVVIVTVIILLIGMSGMYLAGYICYGVIPYAAPMLIAPIPLWLAVINVLILPISTALAEDGLYLGCGVNQIKNKYMAIIIPALFFALQHSFIPTLFDWKYIIYRFLSFLPLTLMLCWYYHKKRNLVPIIVGHTIIDLATVAQILATSCVPGLYEKLSNM